jgi:hypothetical protein
VLIYTITTSTIIESLGIVFKRSKFITGILTVYSLSLSSLPIYVDKYFPPFCEFNRVSLPKSVISAYSRMSKTNYSATVLKETVAIRNSKTLVLLTMSG